MPRRRTEKPADENWVREENLTQWKKKAEQLAADRRKYEKKLIKEGKKQVLIPHPTSPRCFIVKFE